MNKTNETVRFNYFEKLLFKITLILFAYSILLFGIMTFVLANISEATKTLRDITFVALILSGINFFVNLVRVIKYSVKIRKNEENIGIWRSLIGLVLSPITFIILDIALIVMSFSSCTVN